MTFLFPEFLWLLIPLILLLWRSTHKLQQYIHIIILALLVISLAQPIKEEALQETNIQAKDIIIALDISYSMKATDLLPTRYIFAKETIRALLKKSSSDNIMLIAFTTNPLLLSPPTTDHALINIALKSLNPEFILTKGTSLKALFRKLTRMHLGHKNLILMTDGGEESELETLSSIVTDADVSLTILALGSKQGTTVQNKEGSLLKDKQGNLVISRINPLLEDLASSVGGIYLTASSSVDATASELDKILRQNNIETQMLKKMQYNYAQRYQISLMLAIVFFLLLHTRAVRYLILLFALFGVQAEASFIDVYHLNQAYSSYIKQDFITASNELQKIETHSLQSQIALANTYYKNAAFKKAITLYKSIRTSSIKTKQQLYYNIATAYAQLEAYDKAKLYYTKTLQLGKDKDAAFNLSLIALLSDKKDTFVGIAHPKSQGASGSKSTSKQSDKEATHDEDQSSSGSGGGAESKSKEQKEQRTLTLDKNAKQQPLGSKVYDLINKGYINETKPW